MSGAGRFLFANVPIKPGDFVEVVDGWRYQGVAGIVQEVIGLVATVQPVDTTDDWLTPCGEEFRTHVGNLTKPPTPTRIRAAKRKLREKHLAEKRLSNPSTPLSPGNIRTFKQDWDGKKKRGNSE